MLFRMNRSQTSEFGTLHAGLAYDASGNPALESRVKAYIEAGFAELVTEAQLKKEKAKAEKTAAATQPKDVIPADDSGAGTASADGAGAGAGKDGGQA